MMFLSASPHALKPYDKRVKHQLSTGRQSFEAGRQTSRRAEEHQPASPDDDSGAVPGRHADVGGRMPDSQLVPCNAGGGATAEKGRSPCANVPMLFGGTIVARQILRVDNCDGSPRKIRSTGHFLYGHEARFSGKHRVRACMRACALSGTAVAPVAMRTWASSRGKEK